MKKIFPTFRKKQQPLSKNSDSPALYIYAHNFVESEAEPITGYKYPTRHTLEVPDLPESLKKEVPSKAEKEGDESEDDEDDKV